jgi:hypothetical protein
MGVVMREGTADGDALTRTAYSMSFLMYFFLGALSSSCRPYQSIYINQSMADSNSYNRPLYFYPQDNSHFLPSASYVRTQDAFTPQHSRVANLDLPATQFVPKIIESGYIVGPPVAYSQTPSLPYNFQAFSPAKASQPIDTANSSSKLVFSHPSHLYPGSSEVKPAPPTIVIHSPNRQEETVSRALYDRSVAEGKSWEAKYNELQMRYSGLVAGQTGSSSELQ